MSINKILKSNIKPILVSECLLGINCTFSGENRKNEKVIELAKYHSLIPICPEQLGGLSTPRAPQIIESGSGEDVLDGKSRVINRNGEVDTDSFIRGAQEALKIASLFGAEIAILKERSPSCGVNKIYNHLNKMEDDLVNGQGVATALLKRNGLKIFSEDEI
ncbi:MAG: DUF523 domain-containing protein [Candidatus Heimdallarchaeota archaeon]|nr:DUF523 domain-containing protein [Candidatus Heimdallarchaeota archaeon]